MGCKIDVKRSRTHRGKGPFGLKSLNPVIFCGVQSPGIDWKGMSCEAEQFGGNLSDFGQILGFRPRGALGCRASPGLAPGLGNLGLKAPKRRRGRRGTASLIPQHPSLIANLRAGASQRGLRVAELGFFPPKKRRDLGIRRHQHSNGALKFGVETGGAEIPGVLCPPLPRGQQSCTRCPGGCF